MKTNKEIFTYIVKLVTSGIGTLKLMRPFVDHIWPKCYFFAFIIKIHKGTMNRKASSCVKYSTFYSMYDYM